MIERDGRQLRSTRGELLAIATNEESAALLVNTYSGLYEAAQNAKQNLAPLRDVMLGARPSVWAQVSVPVNRALDALDQLEDALKKAEERL